MIRKVFIVLVSFTILLAGCGAGKGYDSASGGMNAVSETTAAAAYDAEASYDMEEAGMEDSGWVAETGAVTTVTQEITSPSGISPTSAPARKLIRNVYMNVETDAFDDVLAGLEAKVTELAGYIEQSDVSGSSITYSNVRPNRYASMIARIPSDKLDQFILLVEGSGNVTNKSESTQDVTLRYSDLESRRKTLTVEQDRIWSLLEKADTLEAVIALEERLSQIRYELESMESQLKLFDNQVEYSTIEITLHEVLPAEFTPVAPESVGQRIQKGFDRNVKNVSEALTNLFIGIIVGIPVWLPLAAALFILFFAIRLVRRKKGKKGPLFKKHKNMAVSFDSGDSPAGDSGIGTEDNHTL